MLDDNLLDDFIHNFYGYGNYRGKYCFIGMEEGGGNTVDEISRRLTTWNKRGKPELEDVAHFHLDIGIPEHFQDPVKLQPTWNKLIRILLSAERVDATADKVREYQKNSLGRTNGDSCLIELLPLPSPSTNRWVYSHNSRLPILETRDKYSQACVPFRSAHIRKRISEHKPDAVVFYSISYREFWEDITGFELEKHKNGDFYIGKDDNSLYVITKHPATIGVTNSYFEDIGKNISSFFKAI